MTLQFWTDTCQNAAIILLALAVIRTNLTLRGRR